MSREDKRSIEPSDEVLRSWAKEEAICELIRPSEREWRLDRDNKQSNLRGGMSNADFK